MSRHIKLAVATVATTLVATLGVAGVATSTDAGPKDAGNYRDRNWCC